MHTTLSKKWRRKREDNIKTNTGEVGREGDRRMKLSPDDVQLWAVVLVV